MITAAPAPWLRLDQAAGAGRGEGRHRRGAGRGRLGRGAPGLRVPSGGQSQLHNFTPHFLEQPSSSASSEAATALGETTSISIYNKTDIEAASSCAPFDAFYDTQPN